MSHSFASTAFLVTWLTARRPMIPLKAMFQACGLALALLVGGGSAAAQPTDPAAADPAPSQLSLQAGIAAAEAGRLADAIKILKPHAKEGDASANYMLGLIYMRAKWASETADTLSHEHFIRAAKNGHVGAVFEVAFQFERGIGTEPDLKRALRLYQLAAQSNHLNAQYNLAVLLSNGAGVEPDLPQAYFWITAAYHNAIRSPNPVLTEGRVRSLAQTIRAKIPYQQAAKASTAAARLAGQPI